MVAEKKERQAMILKLLEQQTIETQNELAELLAARGFPCGQATIARDVRELGLYKEKSPQGGCYYEKRGAGKNETNPRLNRCIMGCGQKVDYANNLVIFKTFSGLASAAGAMFDAMVIKGKVGCVSGNDTVVLAMRDETSARQLYESLRAQQED